jgi:hypothetical protein
MAYKVHIRPCILFAFEKRAEERRWNDLSRSYCSDSHDLQSCREISRRRPEPQTQFTLRPRKFKDEKLRYLLRIEAQFKRKGNLLKLSNVSERTFTRTRNFNKKNKKLICMLDVTHRTNKDVTILRSNLPIVHSVRPIALNFSVRFTITFKIHALARRIITHLFQSRPNIVRLYGHLSFVRLHAPFSSSFALPYPFDRSRYIGDVVEIPLSNRSFPIYFPLS